MKTTYENPYGDATRWLRGNTHAHTCCGRFMDVSESGRIYGRLGYDFFSITDHNKAWPQAQIRGWEEATGIVVVPGEENGATDHIIELGVHDVTPTPSDRFADRAAALKEAGGFVIACHPQEYPHGDQNVYDGVRSIHAIEIYNGLREMRGTDESRNLALWDRVLSEGHRVWGVAADDFHCQYNSPGHGWVCVQAPAQDAPVSWKTIVEQLRRGAFFASTGPNFQRLALQDGRLQVQAERRVQRVRVIGPAGRTLAEAQGPTLEWAAEPGLAYFRVEAHLGIKRAWSQPFFAAAGATA